MPDIELAPAHHIRNTGQYPEVIHMVNKHGRVHPCQLYPKPVNIDNFNIPAADRRSRQRKLRTGILADKAQPYGIRMREQTRPLTEGDLHARFSGQFNRVRQPVVVCRKVQQSPDNRPVGSMTLVGCGE
ncbi:hypothetical protein D3C73_1200910 [compost metagenome]